MTVPATARVAPTPSVASVAAPAAAPATARAAPPSRSRSRLAASLGSTPRRMRLVAVGAVLAALLAGVLGAFAIQQRSTALGEARAAAGRLVLLQTVRNDLVQADADATNSFLIGGLEPAAQRSDYTEQIATAARDLATASASAGAGDVARLGDVNDALTRYTGLIEAARADNRQGLQVGAAYLRQASTVMGEQILPRLATLTAAGGDDVGDAYRAAGNARWWLVLAALGGVGGLVAAQVWLARRTHRYLNLPLAAGSLAVAASLVAGSVVMASAQNHANEVSEGGLSAAVSLAQARTHAFDAKSTESLSLINRGSGAASEPAWKASIGAAQAALAAVPDGLGRPAATALAAYVTRHAQVRTLDDAGDWDAAVASATGRSAAGAAAPASAGAAFTTFDRVSAAALTTQAKEASDGLERAGDRLIPLALLVLLVGVLAAMASWWGISARWEEYR